MILIFVLPLRHERCSGARAIGIIVPRTRLIALLLLVPSLAAAAARVASTGGFVKRGRPVFRGQYGIAGDPDVVRSGATYRMCYTCPDPEHGRAAICLATSRNGVVWRPTSGFRDTRARGLVLRGDDGSWDENTETCALVAGDERVLYYAGYPDGSSQALGSEIGVAHATGDGTFVAEMNSVLERTPGWYDNDAIYSPTILHEADGWSMVYAGHCYTDCPGATGVFLLGATSVDGRVWTKLDAPLLGPDPAITWMIDGAAEPALLEAGDGTYYLFFTGLEGFARVIGIARGPTPFGPWTLDPNPVIVPTADYERAGVLAPSVLLEGGVLRVWYLATKWQRATQSLHHAIGYATASASVVFAGVP